MLTRQRVSLQVRRGRG